MTGLIVKDVILIYLFSLPVVLIFKKLRLPSTIGFLLVGSLLSQHVLGIITEREIVEQIAELGVTLLLFTVGLKFSWSELVQWRKFVISGGLLQIILCIAAGLGISQFFGWPVSQGIYLGAIAALSSTVVVLDVLAEKNLLETPPGRMATGFLILQDLAVVPLLLFLPLLGKAPQSDGLLAGISTPFVGVLLFIVLVFIGSRRWLDKVFHLITNIGGREFLVIAIVTLAFGLSLLTSAVGFSPAIGSFVAGLLIGNTSFNYQAQAEITPFRWTLSSLFFVSIGMLLPWSAILSSPVFIFSALGIFIVKALIIAVIASFLGFSRRTSLLIGVCLGQLGEFSFLIAAQGRDLAILPPPVYKIAITAIVLTLFIAPLAITVAPRLLQFLPERESLKKIPTVGGADRKGHAIICGFGPLGQAVAYLLKQKKISYVIVELNPLTVQSLRRKEHDVLYGDAASPDLLRVAGVENARLVAITLPDFFNAVSVVKAVREINENLFIVTRARLRSVVEDLYAAGANVVISDELEATMEMSRYVLLEYGVSKEECGKFLKQIHEFGSADFF